MRSGRGRILPRGEFLVALLTPEPLSPRAERFNQHDAISLTVSDFAAAEFASAISRRCRTGDFTIEQARSALATLDGWVAGAARLIEVLPVDIPLATGFLRRLDLSLRTPDAIHIAMAQRIGASLVTFDRRMATAAQTLDILVADARPAHKTLPPNARMRDLEHTAPGE